MNAKGRDDQSTGKGTPQGSSLPPLLSNIVLDELDKELERRGHRFVRYADDIIILDTGRKRISISTSDEKSFRVHRKPNAVKDKQRKESDHPPLST